MGGGNYIEEQREGDWVNTELFLSGVVYWYARKVLTTLFLVIAARTINFTTKLTDVCWFVASGFSRTLSQTLKFTHVTRNQENSLLPSYPELSTCESSTVTRQRHRVKFDILQFFYQILFICSKKIYCYFVTLSGMKVRISNKTFRKLRTRQVCLLGIL